MRYVAVVARPDAVLGEGTCGGGAGGRPFAQCPGLSSLPGGPGSREVQVARVRGAFERPASGLGEQGFERGTCESGCCGASARKPERKFPQCPVSVKKVVPNNRTL